MVRNQKFWMVKDDMNRQISVSGWQLIGSVIIFGVVIYELMTGQIVAKPQSNPIMRIEQPISFWIIVGIKVTVASTFAVMGIVGLKEESKYK
ncbi:hypothetical protein B9G53_07360 [Pseudanabaena sp. SR411]|uniref:hypothetical protein n=1 Tax=Pseudanabaena sp. SR411 TaxID=1980935 RepID=UPI000B9964D3|nr:hypothetical protein [Pseudanabaena sp. SR411]OYQ65392.1 hypothetical protein B9G53_07360 [Pseudanabaena sp. SR411]